MSLDQLEIKVFIHLIADIADIYVDDIGIGVEINIPDINGQIGPWKR